MDFTVDKYRDLISGIGQGDHRVCSYILGRSNENRRFIIRHDVDRSPRQALKLARIENQYGVRATYYFRYPVTFNVNVIDTVHEMGHEIGYHYETVVKARGDLDVAFELFCRELVHFDKWGIKTIAMHGNPLSRYNNLLLWNTYDFHSLNIVGEAYLSIDCTNIPYVTDTGRSWNNPYFSRRDKVTGQMPRFRNTDAIIEALRSEKMEALYLSVHPQRWHDTRKGWLWELLAQSARNMGKILLTTLS